ncbi:hypothetical protein [Parerythrobacter jejuensis]|uniref:AcrB/AcrD/AcrF family protein n=1 Tax=Parerythrobacter jejuensis TaxID=795812 RepID=A0A845ARC4_9SPHN|nr:hypothetical protein [Parerythrobacter jejuensis]MXP31056.1 hypothetical protein [Parerythrobacter jejuensis]MXP33816.1 hypothetical protein [Parerythrobacter jejuensis]
MTDRRLRTDEYPLRRILLVWLVVSILLIATAAQNIFRGQFPDPDDVLRLVQVRDLLAGQEWFDLKQHRIDPTGSVPMHWSRLVDLPLVLIIGGLSPLLGQTMAEQVGVILVPLLAMLATMLFVGRMAWRLFDVETAGLACLVVGFLPLLVFQFQPLRIDHHGWQICAVVAAMWAIAGRDTWRGGALAGFAMSAGVTISLELIPVAAIFAAVLGLRWLRDRNSRFGLVGFLQMLALGLAGLFLLTRGVGDLALYCDAITLPHIGFFLIVALGATTLALAPPLPWFAIVVGLGVSGAAGLAFFGAGSPGCLRTPFGELDPLVYDYWYVNVLEGRPLWDQSALVYPQLIQIAAGFATGLHLCLQARDWKRGWWTDYLLVFGGTILLGLLVWRSMAFASVLATVPLGYLLQRGLHRLRSTESAGAKVGIVAVLLLVLLPSAPVVAGQKLASPVGNSAIKGPLATSSCDLFSSAAKLSALEAGTIFAPLDIGPALIQRSHHAVVATGHHRAEDAMRDVIAGYMAAPDETLDIIRKHDARYVVICTDILEPNLYADRGGEGNFSSLLVKGRAPNWLEPVVLDTPGTFKVWRVVDTR